MFAMRFFCVAVAAVADDHDDASRGCGSESLRQFLHVVIVVVVVNRLQALAFSIRVAVYPWHAHTVFGLNAESFNHSHLWTTKLNGCIRARRSPFCVWLKCALASFDACKTYTFAYAFAFDRAGLHAIHIMYMFIHTHRRTCIRCSFDRSFRSHMSRRNPPARAKQNGVHLLWLSMRAFAFMHYVRTHTSCWIGGSSIRTVFGTTARRNSFGAHLCAHSIDVPDRTQHDDAEHTSTSILLALGRLK